MFTETYFDTAMRWLQQMWGASAKFRSGQWEAIKALVEDHERLWVVAQPASGE
jgi:superfamily II DNA helicase RecQ